uniref:non-specific serine/threonine protein kinase n=1 Tax=Fagus sylvatica TaxID=28930 RepID=A0A2N9G7B4_FAGSY
MLHTMGISCFWCGVLLYLPLFLTPLPILVTALPGGYLPVNSSVSWTNSLTAPNSVKFDDGSFVRIILASGFSDEFNDYVCGCGFFCNQTCNSSLFAIFSLHYEEGNISKSRGPEVVWSANQTIRLLLMRLCSSLPKEKENVDKGEEYYLDHVPGMPTRYSYDDLQAMTENFSKELGAGGFGTVFEGTLIDGTEVAVKRLDGLSQIKKSFLAEVETIGSIHHFNLVRLIGFCAEKSHRLLVYEYMSNGSLDRWVFHKNPEILLDWQHRKKIILDIARGLTYLHEECRQKIVHLDIKPQNILLDENFNAKVSDFGLSKLVDRDQSQVVTNMRGTPGYMAPEWVSLVITEKVDVYSFGVVLLEILCGRRNFDLSQPEEAMHLLHLFKKKIEEDRLLDLVDNYNEDMQLHGAEVVNMMRVAARCLQIDYTKRPSMSMVVKVLEDVENVESDLDYFFWNPPLPNMGYGVDNQEVYVASATSLLPSILSGPR